jgi:hypothetical protein
MAEKHFWLNMDFNGSLNGISWQARVDAALTLIVETLCFGNNVLVHCRHGTHRTGVVTISAMALLRIPSHRGEQFLTTPRMCISPPTPTVRSKTFEPRVTSIFQKTGIDLWAGMVRCELLHYNLEYMVFAEVVYGRRLVRPRLQGRGPSGSGCSSMPLGIAASGAGAGSGLMPLVSAPWPQERGPSSASSSSMPPGLAPRGCAGTGSGSKTKARPTQGNLWAAAAKRIREGTGLLVTTAIPGPWFVVPSMAAVTRPHEERTGLATTAAEVRGPRSAVAIPRPSSAQQAARTPPLAQAEFAQFQPALR